MAKEILKNEDGSLTVEQQQKFDLGVAQIVVDTFKAIGDLNAQDVMDITTKRTESEQLLPLANKVFQNVLTADLPASHNQYIAVISNHILQEVFDQVVDKINKNEQSIIVDAIGIPYHDLSPKDVVDYIESKKVAE